MPLIVHDRKDVKVRVRVRLRVRSEIRGLEVE